MILRPNHTRTTWAASTLILLFLPLFVSCNSDNSPSDATSSGQNDPIPTETNLPVGVSETTAASSSGKSVGAGEGGRAGPVSDETRAKQRLPGPGVSGLNESNESNRNLERDTRPLLVEVTAELGLPDKEVDWPDGVYLTPEITAGGVALFDYDLDGDLDIYQVCHCPPDDLPNGFQTPAPNRLFRQTADGRFEEVADAAGLNDTGFGHGCAIGDVDSDGDLDVYVTNYGPDAFFINNGDGSFTESTHNAGFAGDQWSSAAAFVDYDRDGDLDLFVVHFATFDPERRCKTADGEDLDYCGPHLFDGVRDTLYRNNADGTFTDVSDESGITAPARGWGIIATDLTGDSHPDIYICNDEEPNQLWVNDGHGSFSDEAVYRGVAFNGFGSPEASMGVTLGDVDGNMTLDLFMTHVSNETNTLYALEGEELFSDVSVGCGTASVDLPFTGWGCGFFDIDHDGDLDLAVANGRVAVGVPMDNSKHGKFWDRYAETNLLFINDGLGKFTDASRRAGKFGSRPEVTKALAFGDLDRDGDIDLATNDIANRLRIFRNESPKYENHWLQVLAVDGRRIAIGAQVWVKLNSRSLVRPVLRSYSYLASNDPRVHFGLGIEDQVQELSVRWVDGSLESFPVGDVDRVVTVFKGQGTPARQRMRTEDREK